MPDDSRGSFGVYTGEDITPQGRLVWPARDWLYDDANGSLAI
jgi:hypothetical protein